MIAFLDGLVHVASKAACRDFDDIAGTPIMQFDVVNARIVRIAKNDDVPPLGSAPWYR